MNTRYYDANGRHYATEHGPLVVLHPEAPGHIALWDDSPGWIGAMPAVVNADGRTPSDPDSAPPDGAETLTGDWDKKEPVIGCRQAALKLAICILGLGVILAAAVFVTLLAAMGWIG